MAKRNDFMPKNQKNPIQVPGMALWSNARLPFNHKIYKVINIHHFNMSPSDPNGSLDESFFRILIKFIGGFYLGYFSLS